MQNPMTLVKRMRSIACPLLAAAVTSLVFAASPANAVTLADYPAVVADLATTTPTDAQIYAWIEQGGLPAGRAPITSSPDTAPKVDELLQSERRPMPGQPAADAVRHRLRSEIWRARWKTRLLPAFRVLDRVSLYATAGMVGFAIGTQARKLFASEPRPPATPTVTGMVPVPRGTELWSVNGYWWGGPLQTAVAPVDGYYASTGSYTSPAYTIWSSHAPVYGYSCYTLPAATGFAPLASAPTAYASACNPAQAVGLFRPSELLLRPMTPDDEPNVTKVVTWPTGTEGTNGEPPTTTLDRLRQELQAAPQEYPTLLAWLDAHLGGPSQDPTGELIDLPTCTGMTYGACSAALRNAGLTGTITKVTLTADDAIMDVAADRTTALHPGGRVKYNDEVTVTVNPDPLPELTETELLIADELEQNNPDVDPDPETGKPRAPWTTIARHCVKAIEASGIASLDPLDCARIPIFITGYDAADAAITNLQAISQKPRWTLLHRRVADQNALTDRQWYDRTTIAPATCLKPARNAFEVAHGYRAACDEYPFYSSSEGYKGAMNDGTLPHLRLINQKQNTREGDALDWFYGGTGFRNGPFPWPKCNIPATPDSTISWMPEALALGAAVNSAFIVVPLGAVSETSRTTGLCNGRTL
jgi:hypothetical protein